MKLTIGTFCIAMSCALCVGNCYSQVETNQSAPAREVYRVRINNDGELRGRVFAKLAEQEAPVTGKVSLTDASGNTISTARTDEAGTFSFKDVEPGQYKAVGIAGDYAGDAEIVVLPTEAIEDAAAGVSEGYYTAIPLAVAPAPSTAIFDMYSSLPAGSFSTAPSFGYGGGVGGCSTCGGGSTGGLGVRSFGGSGSGCGSCGGGLNFRRLALLGAAIAIPIALSGGDDSSSPDE